MNEEIFGAVEFVKGHI